MTTTFFPARHLTRLTWAALLALGCATAHAQVVPKLAPPVAALPQNTAYYVDGKPATQAEMQAIDPNSIVSIDIIKDAAQQRALGRATSDGVALITTKSGASLPEVQAFNQRFPVTPATPAQGAAIAAAQAYVAQHYPAAKLESAFPAKGKTDRYQVFFTNNGQRVYLLFDGQGHPVEQ